MQNGRFNRKQVDEEGKEAISKWGSMAIFCGRRGHAGSRGEKDAGAARVGHDVMAVA